MNPIESLHVDNLPKPLGSFAVPEMDLSSSRAKMKAHPFVIAIRADALVAYLEPAYLAWVAESKRDDALCGGPQDELAEAGYPDLNELVKNPTLLELVVGHYLLRDFLGKLTWDGSSPIEYWFDQVTHCSIDEHQVRLFGICYSKGAVPAEGRGSALARNAE